MTLRMQFKSPSVKGSTPELDRIDVEISRHVSFQTSGLRSCSLAKLYSPSGSAGQACGESRVGNGSVTSEISVRGTPPVTVSGRLRAFYAFARGRPRVLAQVITGEPLPLVYVIPFTIEARSSAGQFGTDLFVPPGRMRAIVGKCASGHPNCFAPSPYTLVGVYSHISAFSMSLHRLFRRSGKPEGFVSAACPAPHGFSGMVFPLLRARLSFDSGLVPGFRESVSEGHCEVARP